MRVFRLTLIPAESRLYTGQSFIEMFGSTLSFIASVAGSESPVNNEDALAKPGSKRERRPP